MLAFRPRPLRWTNLAATSLAAVALAVFASGASAQLNDILSGGPLSGIQDGASADSPEQIVSVTAHFTAAAGGRPAMLCG